MTLPPHKTQGIQYDQNPMPAVLITRERGPEPGAGSIDCTESQIHHRSAARLTPRSRSGRGVPASGLRSGPSGNRTD